MQEAMLQSAYHYHSLVIRQVSAPQAYRRHLTEVNFAELTIPIRTTDGRTDYGRGKHNIT